VARARAAGRNLQDDTMTLKTALLACALALAAPAALAADYKAGAIEIDHPWARATPGGAKVGAGYLKLTNTGATPDRLVSATAAAAGRVEIHEMSMDNGMMMMRPVKGGVELKPGGTVEFKSGGYHLMLLDLKAPLKTGDHIKGTLTFEKAGPVDVEFMVEGVGGGSMQMQNMK
jgi:copper(I)-binding protein